MKSKVSITKPDADLAKWCAALVPDNVDEVPAGWLCVTDLAAKLNKSRHTVAAQLAAAVREGRAEMQKFRVLTGRGAYPVPHYRLK